MGATGKDDEDIEKTIYDYEEPQFFLSSDRITFNARDENMFLAAKQFMNFGAGNNINFSTSKSLLINAAEAVSINPRLFKVEISFLGTFIATLLDETAVPPEFEEAVVDNVTFVPISAKYSIGPLELTTPTTCNIAPGVLVPIPTLD